MVKGTTRQVIWIKGSADKLFEQAIFLVNEDAVKDGGVTEDELLKEAKQACKHPISHNLIMTKILWGSLGAVGIGLLWILTVVI